MRLWITANITDEGIQMVSGSLVQLSTIFSPGVKEDFFETLKTNQIACKLASCKQVIKILILQDLDYQLEGKE